MRYLYPFLFLSCSLSIPLAQAADEVPTIIVEGSVLRPGEFIVAPQSSALNDTSSLLKRVPGANVNRNGTLTGIASYRGLFGNRVNVTVDNASLKETCPNSMDPALSHIPAVLTESLTVYRGIAPVSSGIESLGGTMEVQARKSRFSEGNEFEYHGLASVGFSDADDGVVTGIFNEFSNDTHRMHLNGSYENGNNYEFDQNKSVSPSEYQREAYSVGYGFKQGAHDIGFDYTNSDTGKTGTPSLPMDIVYARGGIFSADYSMDLGAGHQLETSFFYQDMRHLMDNFSLRQNGIVSNKLRQSRSTVDGGGLSAAYHLPVYKGVMSLGLESELFNHDALISDPTSAMFYTDNFNGVERDRFSAFAEWQGSIDDGLDMELGVRLTQVDMDAGLVGSSMAMMPNPMGGLVSTLRDNFNNSDRSQSDNNVDLGFVLIKALTDTLSVEAGFARKNRSASYQERYLWLPLEATAGLADGRVYIGDINLEAETAYQYELGLEYASGNLYLAPRVFYHQVDDYIQGEASTNIAANNVAMMMTGDTALKFSNVDAELYGFDVEWGYVLADHWALDGTISYLRGQRRDNGDNLYRIAPLNTRAQLNYEQNTWSIAAEVEAYAAQNDVASYNNEQQTGGYSLFHLHAKYQPANDFNIGLGVENVFDKVYADHTSAINRAVNSDVAVGDKVVGIGRNIYVTASYEW